VKWRFCQFRRNLNLKSSWPADIGALDANALVVIVNPHIFGDEINEEFVDFLGHLRSHNITTVSLLSFGNAKYIHFTSK
jgi:hypothetical protein